MNSDEMREHIEAAPLPCEGPAPYSRPEWKAPEQPGDTMSAAYGWSARSLAHGLLKLFCESPDLLAGDEDESRSALLARWPKAFDWSGCSLFQWGWAMNAARLALEAPQVPNPAVWEIRVREPEAVE